MTTKINQDEINGILWKACDTFRGVVDASEYKNYILVMLFVKYISDVWQEHYEQLKTQYGSDEEMILRRMQRERFVLPRGCGFQDLYNQRNGSNIGEIINIALEHIEETNKQKLSGVFRNIDFNSEANLGQTQDRNARLKHLLDAVIGLPSNLFYGTGIPAAVLVFKRNKSDTNVLFIDASREYQNGKNQNKLRQSDIDKIMATCQARETVDKYAYLASCEEIKENDFNLNIPRYVDTFEEEEEIDIEAVQVEIIQLEAELAEVKQEMAGYLKELGF